MNLVRATGFAWLASLMVGAIALTGCDSGPSTVSGTVTVDGKPLENGAISFLPSAGEGPTAGTSIKAGKYTAEVPPGSKRVEITGYEVIGQEPAYGDPNGPMKDKTKSVVPPKFNQQSTLTADIKPGANDNLNFDLTSK